MKAPWTEAERGRIVARAIRFIRKRAELHAFEFAMQVGEHLFTGLFRGDPMLVRAGGAWKRDSLRRIAADERVDSSEQKLAMCVHAYLAVTRFQRHARDVPLPGLSPWEWARLDVPLEAEPDALVELAMWRQKEGVTRDMLEAAAQLVRPYLDRGGKLGDILPGSRGRDTPYGRIKRILGIIDSWLDSNELTRPAEKKALGAIEELLTVL